MKVLAKEYLRSKFDVKFGDCPESEENLQYNLAVVRLMRMAERYDDETPMQQAGRRQKKTKEDDDEERKNVYTAK